jgi:hypothetical protein
VSIMRIRPVLIARFEPVHFMRRRTVCCGDEWNELRPMQRRDVLWRWCWCVH